MQLLQYLVSKIISIKVILAQQSLTKVEPINCIDFQKSKLNFYLILFLTNISA